ncbi:MAG: S-layer homology domain-containing protein [Syntrophomonadaceae bacterium]|nr:S-layer homology domain-containing protein [Syntrophomonadaceae bacterium]
MPIRMKISALCLLLIAFILIGAVASAAESVPANSANPASQPAFKDLPNTGQNQLYINYIIASKIMTGFPDGSFRPEQGISRAQLAVIIARLKELTPAGTAGLVFNDVPSGHWAESFIAATSQGGYMEGFADGSFHPDEELSRAQGIAAIMRLVYKTLNPAVLPPLDDMNASHWAAEAMATALAAGMLESTEGKIFPGQALSRGELARCLAIMLTRHPELYGAALPGKIKATAGEVFVSRQGTETLLSGEDELRTGDQVRTAAKAGAELLFPDGSSVLLAENCSIIISENLGRRYIKADGNPGTRVENLNIKVQEGVVFGALASGPEAGQAEDNQSAALEKQLAAIGGLPELLAVNEGGSEPPWWEARPKQQVRMKIDMPFGVTAIRGTFASIAIAADGKSRVACLIGDAELSSRGDDGQPGEPVALPGGKASSLNEEGKPPAPAEDLNDEDKQGFAGVVEWIIRTAQEMDEQQETAASEEEADEEESVLQKITKTLEDNGIKLDESLMEKIPGLNPAASDDSEGAGAEPEEHKDVALDKSWILSFNEDIDPETIPGNICVSRDAFGIFKVPAIASLDTNIEKIITLKPQDKWGAGQTLYIVVGKGLKSVDGASLGESAKVKFTTVSEEPLGNLLEQAKAMLGLGKLTEAIRLATEAAEQAPDDYRAYLIRGQAYLNLDEEEKAQEDLSQAEDLNPWAPELEALKTYLGWPPSLDAFLPAEEEEKKLELKGAY